MKRFFILSSIFLWVFPCFGAITGPSEVLPGTLTTFTADTAGVFIKYPEDKGSCAADSDGKTLYFTTVEAGEYTLAHCSVDEDNKPVVSTFRFKVGSSIPLPNPKPEPEPEPEPEPSPNVKNLTAADRQAAVYALTYTVTCIENESIKTPQGARSTFKQALLSKGSTCNGYTCALRPALSAVLDEWTERTDFTSVETVKGCFKEFLKEVEK